MLTLTRKIGEALCIGDDIKIVVKEIRGKQVRLGIEAPQEIYVCREELYKKIQAANMMAASAGASGNLDALGGLFGGAPKARKAGKVAEGVDRGGSSAARVPPRDVSPEEETNAG